MLVRYPAAALVVLLTTPAFGQPDAPSSSHTPLPPHTHTPNPIAATPAPARMDGLQQRRALQARSLVANVPFRSVGPTVMSGRVADLQGSMLDPATFWVAYASGGLWKTTSNGALFFPLFDDEAVMTLGALAVDERDPEGDGETVWLGTGESNSSRSSYAGAGVYRSTNGGQTWQHLGLEETHHVGRIVLHPSDPNTAWVAALGHLYSPNAERGVFMTSDGGRSWQHTLALDDTTGASEIVLDPTDPDVLYAATWTRDRRAWNLREAGSGSAIWKSRDGGRTWARLTVEGSGFSTGRDVGRIGLAATADGRGLFAVVDNQARRPPDDDEEDPAITRERLRAMTRDEFLALTADEITAFLDRNEFPLSYTARSVLDMVREGTLEPADLDEYLFDANRDLFDTPVIGAEVYRSDDGGQTWRRTHEDFLDDLFYTYGYYFGQVRVSPHDPQRLYLLGVPLLASSDGGATWTSIDRLDVDADFVHADHHALWLDPARPGRILDGNDGGVNQSWDDGRTWAKLNTPAVGQFYTVAVDDDEPYNVYGGLQDNGVWFGPSDYEPSQAWRAGGQYPFRRLFGGDGMQVQVDPRTHEDGGRLVYTGFQFGNYARVERGSGEAEPVAPRHELGERPLRFNWQTPIWLSRHNADILYMGSHRVHRSLDRGETWEAISGDLTRGARPGDVPYGTVTALQESPKKFGLLWAGTDDGRVWVSRDGGFAWNEVSSGLPPDLWVSRVEPSHHEEGRAYVSLNGYRWDHFDAYVFSTEDFGQTWARIGTDLPREPVNVVREDPANADVLYVGTDHGLFVSLDRGATFMAFDGRGAEEAGLPAAPVHDLAVQARDADLAVATHGRSLYVVDVGLVQSLTDSLRAGPLHVFPLDSLTASADWGERGWTWAEPDEPEAKISFWAHEGGAAEIRIKDERGRTLRTLTDTTEAGLNLVSYDLTSERAQDDDHEAGEDTERFYLRPGDYTVEVRLNGERAEAPLVVGPAPEPPSRRRKTP